jgi:antitoxin YefM
MSRARRAGAPPGQLSVKSEGVQDARFGTGMLHQCSTIIWYESIGGLNVAITASEARSRLFPLIQQVNDDHEPVRISSRSGDAVLMSADDFDSWQETIYLLRSPANARRLMEAVARDKSGRGDVAKTMEELQGLAGE